MKYKHIIFDIDGTLINNEYALLHSLQDTILHLKRTEIPIDDLKFALGIPSEVALSKLGIDDGTTACEIWNNYLSLYNQSIKLYDGIEDVLKSLLQMNYKLGLVTSKTKQELTDDFSHYGIDDLFSIIICVEDSPNPKPSPDPLLSYLAKANIENHEALYIGDSIYDYQCAQGAGVDFGAASWGDTQRVIQNVKYTFSSPEQILELISSYR